MDHYDRHLEHDRVEREGEVSLVDLIRRAGKYKRAMLAILVGIGVLYAIAAVVVYLRSPSVHLSQMGFRLEFRGAERGEYPNGTKFASSEIVSAPVLIRVFDRNKLGSFTSFQDFKNSVSVVQTSAALESLNREYRSKLSDPKVSPVDRDRLEKEFQEKTASARQGDYRIAIVTTDRFRSTPSSLRAKILSDILSVWAEHSVKDKGVSLYDISMLSSGIFKEGAIEGYDYIIALDLIRAKINRVVQNINELLGLPGAKVIRTGNERVSLAELGVRLQDVQDFRIRPLVGLLMAKGISMNPVTSLEFLQTQLRFNELETQEAIARATVIRNVLQTYLEEDGRHPTDDASPRFPPGATAVIPQIDESFLDRIVQMAGEGSDLEFRQRLVNDLRTEAMLVVPLEAEARYYRTLLDSFRGTSRTPPTPEEKRVIESQFKAILAEAVRTTDQVNDIYNSISKDLNPSTVLYSITEPVSFNVERSLSVKKLWTVGLLLLLVATPLVLLGALLYDLIRREEAEEVEDAARAASDTAANTRTEARA